MCKMLYIRAKHLLSASKNDTAAIVGVCRPMSLALRFRWKQNAALLRPPFGV
jgi:hypothetical protein